jgi:hypothetical protein
MRNTQGMGDKLIDMSTRRSAWCVQILRVSTHITGPKEVRLCITDPRNGRIKIRLGGPEDGSHGQVELHLPRFVTVRRALEAAAQAVLLELGFCKKWHRSLLDGPVTICWLGDHGEEVGHTSIKRGDLVDFKLGTDRSLDAKHWVVKS